MVTNYLQNSSNSCQYSIGELRNHIYLFEGAKNIEIDNGSCYIGEVSNLTEFKGYNIQFEEQSSLDERYLFSKSLQLTVEGRLDVNDLPTNIYCIIETYDGTLYFINPDFPLHLSYTFTLGDDVNETVIKLQTLSNMPTLKTTCDDISETTTCKSYRKADFKELHLVESQVAKYDSTNDRLKLTKSLSKVEYNKGSAELVEEFDGKEATVTITFSIPFDNYKTDWQYRLQEFVYNTYVALITADDYYKYYAGTFNPLQPSYTINADQGTITITLRETSLGGLRKVYDSQLDIDQTYTWEYVTEIDGVDVFECSGGPGIAKYILREKTDKLGNPLGEYRCRKDIWDCLQEQDEYCMMYYSYLLQYNITGVWDDVPQNWFPTWKCAYKGEEYSCELDTTMPRQIVFTAATTYTYSFKATCDWTITNIPSFISVTPYSGEANTTYTISVHNTATPTANDRYASITVQCCNSSYNYGITVSEPKDCISPTEVEIDCNQQNVQFVYQGDCELNIAGLDEGLTYTLTNNILTVTVPRNYSTSAVTYSVIVTNCDCGAAIDVLTITQDKTYENWVYDSSYICIQGTKFEKLIRYTGSTSTSITAATNEEKTGQIIQVNCADCLMTNKKLEFNNHYYCVNGNKYELMEEYEQTSSDGGSTWTQWQPTGVAQLGALVEEESTYCSQQTTITWQLSNKSICYNP